MSLSIGPRRHMYIVPWPDEKDISSAYVHIGGYKVDWADFDGEVALRNFIKQWKE